VAIGLDGKAKGLDGVSTALLTGLGDGISPPVQAEKRMTSPMSRILFIDLFIGYLPQRNGVTREGDSVSSR
jgi:hypothetical protein